MRRKRSPKVLGLLLLVAIGLMAMNASAAQAKYELRKNGASVAELKLVVAILLGLLIAENGLTIHCTGGTSTAELKGGGTANVTGSALAVFEGCTWVGASKVCTINGGGIGKIHASGNGTLSMNAANEYYVLAASESFSIVKTEGPFCTIPAEEVVSGSVWLTFLSPESNTLDHLIHVEDDALFLGESAAELYFLAHAKEVSNATWAIKLTGL